MPIKLKDLTCEKCFYARRPRKYDEHGFLSGDLLECKRQPISIIKVDTSGCGEGAWIADNKKINETERIRWSDFYHCTENITPYWSQNFELIEPWWMEE